MDALRAENPELREATGARAPGAVASAEEAPGVVANPVSDDDADAPDHDAVMSEHFAELRRIGMLCADAHG